MIYVFAFLLFSSLCRVGGQTCAGSIQLPRYDINSSVPCPAAGSFLVEPGDAARRLSEDVATTPPNLLVLRPTASAQVLHVTTPPPMTYPPQTIPPKTLPPTEPPTLEPGRVAPTSSPPEVTYPPKTAAPRMTTTAPQHKEKRSDTSGGTSSSAASDSQAPAPTPAPSAAPTDAPVGAQGPPHCTRELAAKLLWETIPREDLKGSYIKKNIKHRIAVYRASPSDLAARDEPATLVNIDVVHPAQHTVGGHKARAEIVFHHEYQDKVRIDLVVPVEVGQSESPVLRWLEESVEPCGFFSSMMGNCQDLQAADIIPKKADFMRYLLPGCAETLVIMTPHYATEAQLKTAASLQRPSFLGTPLGPTIQGLVIGKAIPLTGYFSVWSPEEIKLRNYIYKSIFLVGILVIAFAYLMMKRRIEQRVYGALPTSSMDGADGAPASNRPSTEAQDGWFDDLVKAPRIRPCLVLDHFLMYAVAILIPWLALHFEVINERRGLPWEYHMAFFVCVVMHVIHELFWFSKVSPKASRKVTPLHLAKNAIFGILCIVDYYLDCAFIALAYLMGSPLAFVSLIIFVCLNLVGQLAYYSFDLLVKRYIYDNDRDVSMLFRPRGMEVLHSIMSAHFRDSGCLGESEMRAEISSFVFVFMKFILEDISQCVICIIFTVFFGTFPIIKASIYLKMVLFCYGPCKSYLEITSWARKAGEMMMVEH